jgi:tyrosyl-tRNA synthetase
MSKSDPDSAIFMEDSEEDVRRKVKKAFCVVGDITTNPIIDYCRHIVFPKNGSLHVARKPDNGGDKVYYTIGELEADFCSGELHPGDLKPAFAIALNIMLEPVRRHFREDPWAREVLAKVKTYRVTK